MRSLVSVPIKSKGENVGNLYLSDKLESGSGERNSRVNFNESDLITCFANDYGYKEWVRKAVEFYGDKGDVGIFISSSGKSLNIINGCYAGKKKKFNSIITFSGFKKNNQLKKKGNINFWVNSSEYNLVENAHQFWLLLIVDLLIKNIK